MVREYILYSQTLGQYKCVDDPIGWDKIEKTLSRDPGYLGIFRTHTAELEFFGADLQYISTVFEGEGSEGELKVTVLRKKDYEDIQETEFDGIGPLGNYQIEYKTDNGALTPYVKIKFTDSTFHDRFLTRDKIEIDLSKTMSIDGVDIGAPSYKTINIPQRDILEKNSFELSEENITYILGFYGGTGISSPLGHVIPVVKTEGESENVETPFDYLVATPGLIHKFTSVPAVVSINLSLASNGFFRHVNLNPGGDQTSDLPSFARYVLRRYTDSGDLGVFTDTILHEVDLSNTSSTSGGTPVLTDTFIHLDIDFDYSGQFTLNADEAFSILFMFDTANNSTYRLTYTQADLDVNIKQNFDATTANCMQRHEYLKRIGQIMTDQVDCFKSTIFGTTELGYNSNGQYYNNVALSGSQIRGFDVGAKTTWEKSFKSVRAQYNVGCGIEKVDRKYKIVVEGIEYFFSGKVALTLHNVTNIRKGILSDFTFSDVKVGYNKAEYEEINGLEEYNNKSNYATFIKTSQRTLDLISDERADPYGIEFARRKNKLFSATEDTKYDDDIFTIVTEENLDGTLKPKQVKVATNVLSPGTAYNLDITPRANLERSSDWLNASLLKYPNEYLRFLSADKVTDLEVDGVVEQEDIQNKNLLSPLWINEFYGFDCVLNPSDFDQLESCLYGLVKWSPYSREKTSRYYYGWLLQARGGGESRKGQMKLLRANLGSERLNLIDPQGVDNPQDGTELPDPPTTPGSEVGGLEYKLEFAFE